MGQNRKETWKQLDELWNNNKIRVIDTVNQKYSIFSDIHFGDGDDADDLRINKETLIRALKHYNAEDFKLIFLGDIEELWQFDIESIIDEYDRNAYNEIRAFGNDRLYRVFGNHDLDWKWPIDPIFNQALKRNQAFEALKMRGKEGNVNILLVHGHQGSTESDKIWWISRRIARLYRWIESHIKVDPHTSATKSQLVKNYEKIFYSWAKRNRVIIICGHSHRAIFASKSRYDEIGEKIEKLELEILRADNKGIESYKKLVDVKRKKILELKEDRETERERGRNITSVEKNNPILPCYFNAGCALYTCGITNLEIENDEIRLVKWDNETFKRDEYRKESLSGYIEDVLT